MICNGSSAVSKTLKCFAISLEKVSEARRKLSENCSLQAWVLGIQATRSSNRSTAEYDGHGGLYEAVGEAGLLDIGKYCEPVSNVLQNNNVNA